MLLAAICSCTQKNGANSKENLDGKNLEELRIMRNEIFAKHGYIFNSEDLQEYFSAFEWYVAEHEDVNHLLTESDKENIKLIIDQEEKLKALAIESRTFLSRNKLEVSAIDSKTEGFIESYLDHNEGSIIQDYLEFWGFDIKAISNQLEIIESKVYSNSASIFVIAKLRIFSKSENASGEAFNNYIFEIVHDEAVSKYESGFFLPECTSPDIGFISLSNLSINGIQYIALEQNSYWHPCCGQATEKRVDWLIFSKELTNEILVLEKLYSNDNKMDCGPINPPPPESIETKYFVTNESLYAEVHFFIDGLEIRTEEKAIEFNN